MSYEKDMYLNWYMSFVSMWVGIFTAIGVAYLIVGVGFASVVIPLLITTCFGVLVGGLLGMCHTIGRYKKVARILLFLFVIVPSVLYWLVGSKLLPPNRIMFLLFQLFLLVIGIKFGRLGACVILSSLGAGWYRYEHTIYQRETPLITGPYPTKSAALNMGGISEEKFTAEFRWNRSKEASSP